jgi:hypothetical protein
VARKSKSREARHVRLYHWLMDSAAWKSLNATERAVYVDIASIYAGLGSNNGRIHYSVREGAERLHISKDKVARALATLVERGFIVAEKRGAFNLKGRPHQATEWRLTEFPSDISSDFASKEFTRWKPPEKQNTVALEGRQRPRSPTATSP